MVMKSVYRWERISEGVGGLCTQSYNEGSRCGRGYRDQEGQGGVGRQGASGPGGQGGGGREAEDGGSGRGEGTGHKTSGPNTMPVEGHKITHAHTHANTHANTHTYTHSLQAQASRKDPHSVQIYRAQPSRHMHVHTHTHTHTHTHQTEPEPVQTDLPRLTVFRPAP